MKKEQLNKIQTMLEEEKSKIEQELQKYSTKNSDNVKFNKAIFPDYGDKNDENSNEVAQFSDNLSLLNSLEKSLRDVVKALDRIKDGSYGKCNYCNKPINEKRLMARPTSSSCVECKTRLKSL